MEITKKEIETRFLDVSLASCKNIASVKAMLEYLYKDGVRNDHGKKTRVPSPMEAAVESTFAVIYGEDK